MPEQFHEGPEDIKKAIQDQVPHSGEHHNERPVYDFRNPDGSSMTIEEAMEAGLIHPVPESLGEHRDPSNTAPTEAYSPLISDSARETSTTAEKSKKKRLAGIVAGAVATAALGGFGAAKAFGGDPEPTPGERPVATATTGSDDLGELLGGESTPTQSPEATTAPTPEVEDLPKFDEGLRPIHLAEGEFYPLPAGGTPEEIAGEFCKGISSAITSERDDALRYLYQNEDSPALQADTETARIYKRTAEELRQSTEFNGEPEFAMTCSVTHVESAGTVASSLEVYNITIESEGHILDQEGHDYGTFILGETMNRTINVWPDQEVLLPNGETMTGYLIKDSNV